MKQIVFLLTLSLSFHGYGQSQKAPTLKSILLEQLRTTHNQKDWFVPANTALEGVTPEQASWTDGHGNHSIGQLTNHLIFWNQQALATFKGETRQSSAAITMKPSTALTVRNGPPQCSNLTRS